MFSRRIANFIIVIANQLRWKWRFGKFGWRSRLKSCDILGNPRLINIGEKVTIYKGARLEAVGDTAKNVPKIIIGNGTVIHLYFHCGAASSVTIGHDVLIAGHVYITDHDHVYDDPELNTIKCGKLISKPVKIENGCWLGEGCTILKGVTVGERAVVASNSVVTKDVPPATVVAGVPAKIIRTISIQKEIICGCRKK